MSEQLKGVIMLAGHTTRTSAYIQAMAHHGLQPERVLLYGDPKKRPDLSCVPSEGPLFMPDPSIATIDALANAGWEGEQLEAGSINEATVAEAVDGIDPRLIIFSGYGAELVGKDLLIGRAPFLHIHAGWLPDFRGSTTIYFHLLERADCAASAIVLSPQIDRGNIVARVAYPSPPSGLDIDYIYDPAIRADVLVGALREFAGDNGWSMNLEQEPGEGRIYYVIHPVLKHLAVLSLRGDDRR